MKFIGPLSSEIKNRVAVCDDALNDPARLDALLRTGIMDTPSELAFDRLATLAAKILKVPLTIVSFVSDKKQFFKAGYGLPAPYDKLREVPIDGSICRYTLLGQPIIANDASLDPLLKNHPATVPWGIGAFIALPIITAEGHSLGAFCAVDSSPRVWSDEDIEVMRELTASIVTEVTLREQIEKLKNERVMRETFVAALSHDLRTPLAASKLSAQLLIKSNPESEQIKKAGTRITENVERADRMIQDLLDVSQLNLGERIPLNLVPCNLFKLVNRSLEDLKTVHSDRFVLICEEEINGVWDASAMRRILDNLASNAIKYGDENKPITIHLKKLNDQIQICVHNEGNVISMSDQKAIFLPFYRSSSVKNGPQKGWGLGLALIRGLTEAHGGTITVESLPEHGTTFTVTMPLQSLETP